MKKLYHLFHLRKFEFLFKIILKLFSDFFSKGVSFLTIPIYISYAGISVYGTYTLMTALVGFLAPFISLGISNSLVRFFAGTPWSHEVKRKIIKLFLVNLVLGILAAIVFWQFADGIFYNIFKNTDNVAIFKLGAALIIISVNENFILSFFRSKEWYLKLSSMEITISIITLIAVTVMLPLGFTLSATLIVTYIARLFTILVFLLSSNKVSTDNDSDVIHIPLSRFFRFGLVTTVASIGLSIMHLGDRFMISHFLGAEENGRYSIIASLGFLVVAINGGVNMIIYPRIVSIIKNSDSILILKTLLNFQTLQNIITMPVAAFLIWKNATILNFLSAGEVVNATLITSVIIIGVMLDQLLAVPQYFLYTNNKHHYVQYLWIIGAGINLILNYFLIPNFGLLGAGIATLLSFLFVEFGILIIAYNILRTISFVNFKSIIIIFISIVILCGTLSYLKLPEKYGNQMIFVEAIMFMVGYISLVLSLKLLNTKEVKRFLFSPHTT